MPQQSTINGLQRVLDDTAHWKQAWHDLVVAQKPFVEGHHSGDAALPKPAAVEKYDAALQMFVEISGRLIPSLRKITSTKPLRDLMDFPTRTSYMTPAMDAIDALEETIIIQMEAVPGQMANPDPVLAAINLSAEARTVLRVLATADELLTLPAIGRGASGIGKPLGEKAVRTAMKELIDEKLAERPPAKNDKDGRKGVHITARGRQWLAITSQSAAG